MTVVYDPAQEAKVQALVDAFLRETRKISGVKVF